MYKSFFKSFLDIIIAFIGLLLLSPIFAFVAVGLFFANQGKPFFTQLRPEIQGRIFKIIKFKTMNDKIDAVNDLYYHPTFIGYLYNCIISGFKQ